MKNDKIEDAKYYRCVCGAELLVVNSEELEEYDEISLAMFKYENWTGKLNFKERIRWSWNIFKTGYPFTDQICLERLQIKDLRDHFTELLKRKKNDKV